MFVHTHTHQLACYLHTHHFSGRIFICGFLDNLFINCFILFFYPRLCVCGSRSARSFVFLCEEVCEFCVPLWSRRIRKLRPIWGCTPRRRRRPLAAAAPIHHPVSHNFALIIFIWRQVPLQLIFRPDSLMRKSLIIEKLVLWSFEKKNTMREI